MPTQEQIAKLPKWAQEHIAAVTDALLLRSALRWTEPVEPDVPPPQNAARWDKMTKGWIVMGSEGRGGVERACSSSIHHGWGTTEKTTTQGPRSLYSTRLLALKAWRYETETSFAGTLMRIDKQIASEMASPTPLTYE